MKIIRRIVLVGLVVGYFLWPYHAVQKFAEAVEAKDKDTVAQMVDFDALRTSLLELGVEAAVARVEEQSPGKGQGEKIRASVKAMMESPAMKQQLEKQISADAITQMFTAESGKSDGQTWRNKKWESPIAFSVQDPTSEARAIFRFKGLSWKLCSFEVPAAEMRRFTSAHMR